MKDLADYFRLEDVGKRIEDLETPVPIIDLDIVERNVQRWQERCDRLGLANRPHIKTHKLVGFAKYQLDCGAKGITVQKLGEADVMADAGLRGMLLTFNVVGRHKLTRLAALARRTDISVVADSEEVIAGLSHAGQSAGRKIKVLVECDTSAHRNGVQSPQAAALLAQAIDRSKGLSFGGLMTYPAAGHRGETESFLLSARAACAKSGLAAEIISSGGSPDMWKDEGLSPLTEYRAGTYIYFDRSLVERGACQFEDCALRVLATVVSQPTPGRAIIDAGTKALTSDLLGLQGYGVVHDLDDARVYGANEEHGFLDISHLAAKPKIGGLVTITPNHVCPVSNLFDRVVLVRGAEVIGAVKVDARGCVQ
jgi:D-serine deaminase-like pyridoxal phosphate-dependent protein